MVVGRLLPLAADDEPESDFQDTNEVSSAITHSDSQLERLTAE